MNGVTYDIISNSVDKKYIKESTKLSDNRSIYRLKSDNGLLFTIDVSNNCVRYQVQDNSGFKKDESTKKYNNNLELKSIIETITGVFNIMKDDKVITNTESDNTDEILLEHEDMVTSLDEGFDEVKEYVTKVADKISSLSDITDDVEMKEIITSLANSAYALAIDIEDAKDTYAELQEEDALDDTDENEDESLDLNI